MENIGKDNYEQKKPEITGESDNVKKKKKKIRTGIPLPIEKSDTLDNSDKKEILKDKQETGSEKLVSDSNNSKTEQLENKENDDPEALRDESEEAESSNDEEYMGELIIDHSDESYDLYDANIVSQEQDEDQLEVIDAVSETNSTNVEGSIADGVEAANDDNTFSEQVPYFESVSEASAQDMPKNTPWESLKSSDQIIDVPPSTNELTPNTFPTQIITDRTIGANMINPNQYNEVVEVSEPVSKNKEYYAEKRGLSKGVTTGLIFGWFLGKRNRSSPKEIINNGVSNSEAILNNSEDVVAANKVLKKRISILERTQQELQRAVGISVETGEKLTEKIADISSRFIRTKENTFNTTKPTYEPDLKNEITNIETKKTIEQYLSEAEDRKEEVSDLVDSRVETSAWHRIEIDNKTGKLVEKPSLEYGEAFAKEQQQEKLARQAATEQTASQLGSALFGSGSNLLSSSSIAGKEEVNINPIKTDRSLSVDYAVSKIAKNTTNPAIWAVALLVVIFMVVTGII